MFPYRVLSYPTVCICYNVNNVFSYTYPTHTEIYTLSLHDALPIFLIFAAEGLTKRSAVGFLLRSLKPTALRLVDRKSGSAGMPRPISYAVFCLKKKKYTFY